MAFSLTRLVGPLTRCTTPGSIAPHQPLHTRTHAVHTSALQAFPKEKYPCEVELSKLGTSNRFTFSVDLSNIKESATRVYTGETTFSENGEEIIIKVRLHKEKTAERQAYEESIERTEKNWDKSQLYWPGAYGNGC